MQEPGRVTGYALGLEGHCDPETSKGMLPGSRLKADGSLSYQRLLRQWEAGERPVSVQAKPGTAWVSELIYQGVPHAVCGLDSTMKAMVGHNPHRLRCATST